MTKATQNRRTRRQPTQKQVDAAEQTSELIEATAEIVADGAMTVEEATDTVIDAGAVVIDNDTQQVVSQPDELADLIAAELAAEANVPDSTEPTPEPVDNEPDPAVTDMIEEAAADATFQRSGSESPTDDQTDNSGDPTTEAPTEAPAAETTAAPVDPFADLPMTTIEDYEFRDLGTAETSDPRKYETVHKAALEQKLPMKPNWKHATAMITTGRVRREFKAGSVYGTIDQIVSSYGRAGVPAYVLVSQVRQRQIGNKRSHYCTSLPPIGWAEGWIDTFVSKGHGKIMEKKAPVLTVEEVKEIVTAEAEAERKAA